MDFAAFRDAFTSLTYDFLLRAMAFDPSQIGVFAVEDGELVFRPFSDITVSGDLIPEITVPKNGHTRIKFYDKTELIRLAKALGVFENEQVTEVEELPEWDSCNDSLQES